MSFSDMKAHAKRVKADAYSGRATQHPDPDSMHWKLYRYWMKKTGHRSRADNFCHYWRVVLIWAPLRWLEIFLYGLLTTIIVGGLVTIFVLFPMNSLTVLAGAACILYVVVGLFVSAELFDRINRGKHKNPSAKDGALGLAFLPVVLVATVVFALLLLIWNLFVGLHEQYDLYGKVSRWFVETSPSKSGALRWLRPWEIFPLALIVLSFWFTPVLIITLTLAGLAGVVGVVVGLSFLADYFKAREQKAKAVARKKILESDDRVAVKTRKRSWFSRVFGGIVGMFALIWSAIVAGKLKICPLMELPVER